MHWKTFFISSVGLLFLTIPHTALADVSEHLKQAQTYQKNGQYEQAEAIHQQIITAFPDTNDALEAQKQLAIIYIATDKQQKADAAFKKLVKDFSKHKGIAKAVWQIAKKYEKSKKYEKAIQLHQYNVDHLPNNMYAMWSQVESVYSHIRDGNEPAADAAFDKLLKVFSGQPTLPKEIYQIAMKYNQSKRNDKALELHRYNAEHSSRDDMYAMWSQVESVYSYIRDANNAAADTAFNKLLAVFSQQPALLKEVYQVANAYDGARRYDKSRQLYQHVIDNSPKTKQAIWAQANLIKSYLALGDDASAEAAVNKLLANFSNNALITKAVYEVAQQYRWTRKKYEKAFQLDQYNVDHFSHDMYAMWSQVEVIYFHIRSGDFAAADAAFDKLLAVFSQQPTLPKEVYQIANVYSNAGRYDKARQLYQYVIDHWPKAEQAMGPLMGVALSSIGLGDYPGTNAAIDALLTQFPGHKDLPKSLYQIAQKLKADQKALVLYQYIIQNHSDDEHAILSQARIGSIYIRQGDNNTAQDVLNRLLIDFPGHPILPRAVGVVADGYYVQALLLESQGLDEQAGWYYQKTITECQRILNQLPETRYTTAEACYFLGVCYERLGQLENAIEFYQKVVDKWPDFKYAWNALFLVGLNYEKLKNSGLIPPAKADAKTKIAYERLLKDYPTCTAANIARQWLSRQAETK